MASDSKIIGVRFQKVGKVYHFDASQWPHLVLGDFVVVDTSRGRQLGQIVQFVSENRSQEGSIKPIHRQASAQDMLIRQYWQNKEAEALLNCHAKAKEMRIDGVKFVASEFSLEGSRLLIYYNNEAGERMEFKGLRRSMRRIYPQSQIEFHLIGPRDVAKILGGMGACGLANRCCSTFLTDFSPISIKMAKEQGISLTPTEITGICGRLRCCLIYEYEQYVEVRKQLPKRGKRVITPAGEGKIVDIMVIKDAVLVELDRGGQAEFSRDDIQPGEELEALKRKSESGSEENIEGDRKSNEKRSRKHVRSQRRSSR